MSECPRKRREFLGQTVAVAGGAWICATARLYAAAPAQEQPSNSGKPNPGREAMKDAMLGYCGLYCGGCQSYQETQAGGRKSPEGEAAACEGCASSVVAPWCRECEIKACAKRKGLRYCLPCDEYPCAKLTAFTNDPRYPYHKAVHRDMARLREVGTEAWLREQAARWVCGTCGHNFHWFARKCGHCGTRVNAEHWPD